MRASGVGVDTVHDLEILPMLRWNPVQVGCELGASAAVMSSPLRYAGSASSACILSVPCASSRTSIGSMSGFNPQSPGQESGDRFPDSVALNDQVKPSVMLTPYVEQRAD